LIPFLALVASGIAGGLGANPIETVIRSMGDWALRFLVIALAVTPLRKILGWPSLARYRRMFGLWAFAYACLHVAAYVVLDQFFDWHNILLEILKHKFITAGMAAFLILVPLASTSTNGMIRRLGGGRWRRLHKMVYVAGPLAAVHYLWMVKADIREPLIYCALVIILLGYRTIRFLRDQRMAVQPE
jgi:sulfoxide reductase heme-binding subunit YedZ